MNIIISGSTGVACVNLNRSFIGIELNDNYFNIAEERINKIKKECIQDDSNRKK